jgi:hypothetical protein
MLEAEEAAVHSFLKRVLDIVQIDQQQFEMTHGKLANDPQTAEYVMAAQQGKLKQQKPDMTKPPKLDKQSTLNYLKKSQTQAMEQMESMKSQPMMDQGGDPMEMMIKMMVQQAKMQDELYEDTKVEHDIFEESLMVFMTTDKEVQQEMQQYMMKMRAKMGMQGGGF